MDIDATPPVSDSEHRALVAALEQVDLLERDPYRDRWRRAALQEAALGDDADVAYAFSPRSTRGATRA